MSEQSTIQTERVDDVPLLPRPRWPHTRPDTTAPQSWLTDVFNTARPATPPHVFPELTDREREILTLIAQGYTNAAMAERLVLSLKTVRNYVSNIFGKLQVADRAQAIIRARDAGLGQRSP
jgi:DNA-binding NarL/FixJ family response regulator